MSADEPPDFGPQLVGFFCATEVDVVRLRHPSVREDAMSTASNRLNERNVFEFARSRLDERPVELDLSRVQPDRVAASILTGVLLTSAADAVLHLTLPPGDSKDALAENGILFAVANRRGQVTLMPENPAFSTWLEEWRRPWSRGTRQPLLRLLQESEEFGSVEPSVFGRNYAAFVNPHRAGGVGGTRSGVAEVVRTWLHRLLPRLATSRDRTPNGPQFIQGVGRLLDELVENVSEHAAKGRSLDVYSFVHVSLARGGEDRARYRLHITVIDTGPGILETACEKVDASGDGKREWTAGARKELLGLLFCGGAPNLGRARGFGLPEVWETVRRWDDARLTSVTNGLAARSEGNALAVEDVDPVMRGTIISATFPLPPRLREGAS